MALGIFPKLGGTRFFFFFFWGGGPSLRGFDLNVGGIPLLFERPSGFGFTASLGLVFGEYHPTPLHDDPHLRP